MNNDYEHQNGVFPSQWIQSAIEQGIVSASTPISPSQIQPNSLDLRVDSVGYRIQSSFLPGREGIQKKLERFKWYDLPLDEAGLIIERNQVCIFPLLESLNLPANIYARANPKSTTGRLDVFTRLVTESGITFDEVPPGYKGRLYLEVVPRSFAIRLRSGDTLAQLRFQSGNPYLTSAETKSLLDNDSIIFSPDLRTLRSTDLPVLPGIVLSISIPKTSISIPKKNNPTVGYQAKKNTEPIDLKSGMARVRRHWDRIYGDGNPVILHPEEFYIFASRELVRLPPAYCAEMLPFDPGSGELRTHYAGFFDSGFGYASGKNGDATAAAVVLEIRSRDVPFLVEDGQPLFRLNLLKNIAEPDIVYGSTLKSNYQSQRLRLSKQFSGSPDDESIEDAQPKFDFSDWQTDPL